MKKVVVMALLLFLHLTSAQAVQSSAFAELVAEYQQRNGFSGSVLVIKNGKTIFKQAVGHADDAKSEPVTLSTRFNIGSIQKDLTAVLVLQAQEQGLLSVNDTLDKFSLGFSDPQIKDITILQLLQHRSGFADIFTAEYREHPSRYKNIDEKLAILQHEPLLFSPGSERKYSNYGYIVLGAILEKVTSQSYWQLLKKNVHRPSRSGLTKQQLSAEQGTLALPYHLSYEGKRLLVEPLMREVPSPDGGGKMSVYELCGFYQHLFEKKTLLTAKSLQSFKALQKDQTQWLAFGGGTGISTAVELDFENDIWVVVLANTDRLVAEALSARLRSLAHSGEHNEVKQPAVLFTYQQYRRLGEKAFHARFEDLYQQAGYQTFIGKTVTDLARELVSNGQAHQSIPFFDYLTKRFSEHAEVYDGLAFGYFSAGRITEAKAAFAKARALNSDYNSLFNASNYTVAQE